MEPVPWCKPLRLIELSVMIICFSLLFFTREYANTKVIPNAALVFFFVVYSSMMFLTFCDVLSQLARKPTVNTPMIFFAISGCVLCCIAAFLLIFVYLSNYTFYLAERTLNVISLLAAASFFGSLVYLIDAIILIRFV